MGFNLFKSKGLNKSFLQRACAVTFDLHGLKRRYYLDPNQTVTLGRSKSCDICIPHHSISPLECRIERNSAGEILLFSENPQSPVRINGYAAEFSTITAKDKVKVGPVTISISDKVLLHAGDDLPDPEKGYSTDFGSLLIKSIKRSHWFTVSVLIHLAIILVMYNIESKRSKEAEYRGFTQTLAGDDIPLADIFEDIPPEEEIPEIEEIEPLDPVLSEMAFAHPDINFADDMDFLQDPNVAGRPLESQGGEIPDGLGGKALPFSARKKGDERINVHWKKFRNRMGATGLDIAVLFDSTGSMSGFITEVKGTIKEMVHVMREIVPDTQLSLITYKGSPQSSKYIVSGTPLVGDAYELFNFMRTVQVSGGSAEGHAAIASAMSAALYTLKWREGTNKVVVLIGDAPPFPTERKRCLDDVRRFEGKVAAIYKQSSGVTVQMAPETVEYFQQLAKTGAGPFIRYDGEGDVVQRIVSAVLGIRWQANIKEAFKQKRTGRWERRVQRKVNAGDLSWMMQNFERPHVRSEVVDALIAWDTPCVAREMWQILNSTNSDTYLVQRALYVLWHLADVDVPYDPLQRSRLTQSQQIYVSMALQKTFGDEFQKLPQ